MTSTSYPYGLPHALISSEAAGAEVNRRKFGGKELMSDHGYNSYDFVARHQNPAFPHFTTPDPLAEKFKHLSPHLFCAGDPINLIDPTGMGSFWHNGVLIGTDGIDDGNVYVVRDVRDVDSEAVDGLSKQEVRKTVDFIKEQNETQTQENIATSPWVYNNCVKIEPSEENRNSMVKHVSQDNGKGGTKDINNREHGGYINDGVVVFEPSGPVADPSKEDYASISITVGYPSFHSHPSGTKTEFIAPTSNLSPFQSSSASIFGGRKSKDSSFVQTPSPSDISNAGSHICYVFGMGNKTVYIYNSRGIQATIPLKYFVTPKKAKK